MASLPEIKNQLAELNPAEKTEILHWLIHELGDSFPGIEKTPGVVGGEARIARTRIPVWTLVQAQRLGMTEAEILMDFPSLTPQDLIHAWAYAQAHPAEIDQSIDENENA